MTPERFKAIRKAAGLSLNQLAGVLGISDGRSVRRWEDGERAVSGPVQTLMEMIAAGELPHRYMERGKTSIAARDAT